MVLWLVVDQYGRPQNLRVARSLGMGLDEKAMEAVRQWKFEPAMKDGRAVAEQINVEVNFTPPSLEKFAVTHIKQRKDFLASALGAALPDRGKCLSTTNLAICSDQRHSLHQRRGR